MTTDIKITPDQHYTRSEIIQIGEEAKPVLFRFKKSTLRKLLLEKKFPPPINPNSTGVKYWLGKDLLEFKACFDSGKLNDYVPRQYRVVKNDLAPERWDGQTDHPPMPKIIPPPK